jgi:DNA topoisomerase-3
MVQGSAGGASPESVPARRAASSSARVPTEKMISFARSLARAQKVDLPEGVDTDFQVCRGFLDAHAPTRALENSERRSRASNRRRASSNQLASGDELS